MSLRKNKGFSLMELMIAVTILIILSEVAVVYGSSKISERGKENVCLQNRSSIERAERLYVIDKGIHSVSLSNLVVVAGYMKTPECPSRGIYAWSPEEAGSAGPQSILGCSVHGGTVVTVVPEVPPPAESIYLLGGLKTAKDSRGRTILVEYDSTGFFRSDYMSIKAGKDYILNTDDWPEWNSVKREPVFYFFDKNEKYLSSDTLGKHDQFQTPDKTVYVRIMFKSVDGETPGELQYLVD